MKHFTLLAALLVAIPSLEAQKKEIKKAQQEVNAGNLSSATSYLRQAKRIFAAADDKTRANYYIVEAEIKLASPNLDKEAVASISNSLRLANSYDASSFAGRVADIEAQLTGLSAKAAVGEFNKKNFAEAAKLYKVAYKATQDTIHLFNAAKSHLLAKEYHDSFDTYSRLYYMGFTASKFRYAATNVQSGKKEVFANNETVFTGIEEVFNTSAARNTAVNQGTHKKPEKVVASSKVPELLRGLTTAAIQVNKQHAAVTIIDDALAKRPNDKALINQVFHLYRQLGEKAKYNRIMDLLIQESPNDPTLFYNFGVSSSQSNDLARAKEFYKKTLALDPNHLNAKSNLANLLLDEETTIVEEMNSLGMSAAEDKRYDELKKERTKLYNEVLPYLESIVETQPQNKDWVKKLMSIYSYIGQDTKMAILQEKIDE